ncbi:hypothetical protein CK203_061334 [Vitis vinifera]|uniref:Reverse transcriptase domain-containing protein n=1 Tax=Vitis vinifera TaxID=29760 RepID=A0A438GHM5_VITVI|nr:hypothetical protein CK203_061334 [Vitis vinifera]
MKSRKGGQCISVSTIQSGGLVPFFIDFGDSGLLALEDDVMRFFREFYEHRVKGRSEEGVQISHLLFVDDTLVFFQASQDQLTYLSRVENIDDVALHFGCRVGSLPSTYLGLLLGAPFKSVIVLDGVEERSLEVRERLKQIQRDFLWGGGNLERKPHLVRWEYQCLRKYGEERGGWCSPEVREAHGVGLWKGLRMEWDFVGSRISFPIGGRNLLGAAAWEESAQRCGRHGVLD